MCVSSVADMAAAWDNAKAARLASDAFDRRDGGLFPAYWLRGRSDEDLQSLYGWLEERFDAARAAQKPFFHGRGPEASAKFWLLNNRTSALLRQLTQVGREKRRRLGFSF